MNELKYWVAWVAWMLVLLGLTATYHVRASPTGPRPLETVDKTKPAEPIKPKPEVIPRVSIDPEAEEFGPGRRTIQVTARISPAPTKPVSIRLEWSGTATSSEYDVADLPRKDRLTFAVGQEEVRFKIARRLEGAVPRATHELIVSLIADESVKVNGREYVRIQFRGISPTLKAVAQSPTIQRTSGGLAVVDLEVNPPQPEPVRLRYTLGGRAQPDQDYRKPTGPLEVTIGPGKTESIRIPILDFSPVGTSTNLEVHVEPADAGSLGLEPKAVTFEIVDDQPMPGKAMVIVLNTEDLHHEAIGHTADAARVLGDRKPPGLIGHRPFLLAGDGRLYRWHPDLFARAPRFVNVPIINQRNAVVRALKDGSIKRLLPDPRSAPFLVVVLWQNADPPRFIESNVGIGEKVEPFEGPELRLLWASPDAESGDRDLHRLFPRLKNPRYRLPAH